MRQNPTMRDRFQRALDKIDRRLENPAYSDYEKKALWENRNSLFEQKAETDEERLAQFDELDWCLRNIDRSMRQRR
jgi:hypothetical protein